MHTFDLEMLSPNLMQQCTEYSQFYSKLNSYTMHIQSTRTWREHRLNTESHITYAVLIKNHTK